MLTIRPEQVTAMNRPAGKMGTAIGDDTVLVRGRGRSLRLRAEQILVMDLAGVGRSSDGNAGQSRKQSDGENVSNDPVS